MTTSTRAERGAALVAVLAVVVPIVVAGVHAALDGWHPIGDNGLIVLRARDVLTEHHPWLGTWTSASLSIGTPINNPGPSLFDLLAPFAKVDPGGGVAIGVALLNAATVVLVAVFAGRVGGARLVAIAMVAAGALVFAMGSELLFDPWQPHSMLLPFLALVVLAVALAAGDSWALPWAVGIASHLVQTHLSYAVVAPGVLLAALVWAVVAVRRRPTDGTDVRSARTELRRAMLVAVLVGLALWAQPLWEQVARGGNLVEVATSAGGGDDVVGAEAGVRIAGSVVGEPTGWLRPGFDDTFEPDPAGVQLVPEGPANRRVRSLPAAAASLVAVAALLGAAAWLGRRSGRRLGPAVAVVGGSALVLAVATSSWLPVSEAFGISPHQVRYLWPIAIATAVLPWAAVLPRRAVVTLGAAALAVVAGAAAVVPANVEAGPSADVAARPAVRSVLDQLDAVPTDEVLYFDGRSVPFAEPFSGPVLLELQRRGIEFEVDEEFSYQVGPGRRGRDEATRQLRLVVGTTDPAAAPPGSEVVAIADGLTSDERARLAALPEGSPEREALQRRADRFSVVVALEPLR
ncbi:MAG: hypothetical protein ACLGIC_05260 [Acidimicrobiia bacterium]